MPAHPIRVLMVDDHPLFREGVASLLATAKDIDLVGEAGSGEQAIKLVDELSPDVVLMDLHMPGTGGIEATRTIARRHPDVGVIVLTMLDDDDSVFAAVRAGASGYVVKDAERGSLLRAIRAVASGEALLGSAIARRVLVHLEAPDMAGADPDPDIQLLTRREREILTLIADGLRNVEIAERLVISERTVGNHISSIFRKLHVADRTQAVIRARDAGLGRRRHTSPE
jgi:DNA-binding NarL/FixJ family response regulator